jgi:hypothetical protein
MSITCRSAKVSRNVEAKRQRSSTAQRDECTSQGAQEQGPAWLSRMHVGEMQWHKGSVDYHIPPSPSRIWMSGVGCSEVKDVKDVKDAGNRRRGLAEVASRWASLAGTRRGRVRHVLIV